MSRVPPRLLEHARALHAQNPVVDLHNDFLLKARFFGRDFRRRNRRQLFYTPWWTDLDLPRSREAGVAALGFALWAGWRGWSGAGGRGAFAFTNDLLDRLETFAGTARDDLVLARDAPGIRAAHAEGRLAAFVGIEGAQAIEDDLDKLAHFHQRGVRYLGLTWNTSPSFARSAAEARRGKGPDGLSAFGRDVVRRANELGVLLDLAHASEATCWDVLDTTTVAPFNSHAGAASVHAHARNLPDDLVAAIARAGGVIGVIFCPTFLGGLRADIATVADHVDRLAEVGGPECVALGSDFDGFIPLVRGMRDVRDLPALTAVLLERGHSEAHIAGYLGGNVLRYFGETLRA